jgi:hypothetical protein
VSYPQPSSNQYLTGGYPFFRLNTPLVSPGDIYETEVGACAFALGPESDVSRAKIFYLDDQAQPTLMNQVDISSDRLLVGKIYARLDAQYLPAKRKGRIFLAADDLYDPAWRPVGFDVEDDRIDFVSPNFDVLQYFSEVPSLAPQRADRRYYFQDFATFGGTQYLVLPFYGRRYACITARNANATDNGDFGVVGLDFAITDDTDPTQAAHYHQTTELLAPTTLAPAGGQTQLIVTAGKQGMFDVLVLSITKSPMVIHAIFSDDPESQPGGGP